MVLRISKSYLYLYMRGEGLAKSNDAICIAAEDDGAADLQELPIHVCN